MDTALHLAVWMFVIILGGFTAAFLLAFALGIIFLIGTWYDLYKKEMDKKSVKK